MSQMKISKEEYNIALNRNEFDTITWFDLQHNQSHSWRVKDLLEEVNLEIITVVNDRRVNKDRRKPRL